MLKKLTLDNITTFQHAEFNLSKGINIIIGENSSGKSHVLKMAYSVATIWEQCGKEAWSKQLAKKIIGVFGIEGLLELRNHTTLLSTDIYKYSITSEFFVNHKSIESQQLSFVLNTQNKISINGSIPHAPLLNKPIFIPAKEVLSVFPNFISLYEKFALSFDETYYDLCKAIDNPLLKNPDQNLISKLENIMGGKIVFKGNQFYLQTENGEMNIFMVAEGWRKLGMLSYLIANDSLKENSILFWDEPETNLNPRLIKQLAAFLVELSQHNIQIIIATHNLFLMKYFDYLLKQPNNTIPAAFFSLVKTEKGVSVEQGERLNQLTTIAALEEELALYDQEQALMYSQW
ncbi:MAG: ATP-binding protein [Methylococcales bacterium]|nr:ATP-binding protein [Methylococcales bacterium]MDP3840343.1 ATP-binding protein [Methylococcales bacterium]